MGIESNEVARRFKRTEEAPDTDSKGKAFEDLVAYLFKSIPGCIVLQDSVSYFGAEQVDVSVGIGRSCKELDLFPSVVLVECKDWSRPVGSTAVGYFINTLANRSVETGILVAASGITGNREDLKYAHSLGISALARGIRVLVITAAEIASLTSSEDFTNLLQDRYLRAVSQGGLGVPMSKS